MRDYLFVASVDGTVTLDIPIQSIVEGFRQMNRAYTEETLVLEYHSPKSDAVQHLALKFPSSQSSSPSSKLLDVLSCYRKARTGFPCTVVSHMEKESILQSIAHYESPSKLGQWLKGTSAKNRKAMENVKAELEVSAPVPVQIYAGDSPITVEYRDRINALYEKYCPTKIGCSAIEEALIAFRGQEQELMAALVKKYGPEPKPPTPPPPELPPRPPTPPPTAEQILQEKIEEYFRKHDPKSIHEAPALAKQHCHDERELWSKLFERYGLLLEDPPLNQRESESKSAALPDPPAAVKLEKGSEPAHSPSPSRPDPLQVQQQQVQQQQQQQLTPHTPAAIPHTTIESTVSQSQDSEWKDTQPPGPIVPRLQSSEPTQGADTVHQHPLHDPTPRQETIPLEVDAPNTNSAENSTQDGLAQVPPSTSQLSSPTLTVSDRPASHRVGEDHANESSQFEESGLGTTLNLDATLCDNTQSSLPPPMEAEGEAEVLPNNSSVVHALLSTLNSVRSEVDQIRRQQTDLTTYVAKLSDSRSPHRTDRSEGADVSSLDLDATLRGQGKPSPLIIEHFPLAADDSSEGSDLDDDEVSPERELLNESQGRRGSSDRGRSPRDSLALTGGPGTAIVHHDPTNVLSQLSPTPKQINDAFKALEELRDLHQSLLHSLQATPEVRRAVEAAATPMKVLYNTIAPYSTLASTKGTRAQQQGSSLSRPMTEEKNAPLLPAWALIDFGEEDLTVVHPNRTSGTNPIAIKKYHRLVCLKHIRPSANANHEGVDGSRLEESTAWEDNGDPAGLPIPCMLIATRAEYAMNQGGWVIPFRRIQNVCAGSISLAARMRVSKVTQGPDSSGILQVPLLKDFHHEENVLTVYTDRTSIQIQFEKEQYRQQWLQVLRSDLKRRQAVKSRHSPTTLGSR
jgi:hypothetical protein